MILETTLLALISCGTAIAGGYLFGVRRGAAARRTLDLEQATLAQSRDTLASERDSAVREREAASRDREQAVRERENATNELRSMRAQVVAAQASNHDAQALRRELEQLTHRLESKDDTRVDALRGELRALATQVREREVSDQKLRATIEAQLRALSERSTKPEDLQKELKRAMAPLIEREAETKGLRDLMQKAISPLLERERIGKELARLELSKPAELPSVLDAIAQNGGFSAVVLSDDAGLPLAASNNTEDADVLAGSSSIVFTLTERAEREGRAAPVALVSHHADNQVILHRVFDLQDCRLILTAVARGRMLTPDSLDPALGSIERVLQRRRPDVGPSVRPAA
ncbi:MAG: hypothetical protein U0271_14190 [Polyangiaceae bacterium]